MLHPGARNDLQGAINYIGLESGCMMGQELTIKASYNLNSACRAKRSKFCSFYYLNMFYNT